MNTLLVSYLTLRKMIGYLGLILIPALLLLHGYQPSVSAFYYTPGRDLFVITMGAMGAFLVTYRGFDRRDTRVSRIAGGAAILVAMCPTPSLAHSLAAAVFFGATGYTVGHLFTLSEGEPTPEKLRRNRVYLGASYVQSAASIVMALGTVPFLPAAVRVPIVWPEMVAAMAFAVAWLVKGEWLRVLADSPKESMT